MAAVGLLVLSAPASAQERDSPLVPRGRLRLDFDPAFVGWDARFGRRSEGGTVIEEVEPLGIDLTDPRGTAPFPTIDLMEAHLRELLDDPAYRSNLGATSARIAHEVTRVSLGARVGVFDWLTIGVDVPWVKTRTTLDVHFDPDTSLVDLGINPLLQGGGDATRFLEELLARAVDACNRADALCSGESGSPDCRDAQTLADDVTHFLDGLQAAMFASPFFPLAGSGAAGSLSASVSELSHALETAGLSGIDAPLPFATVRLAPDEFRDFPASPVSGIGGLPLGGVESRWALGDLELSAMARLFTGVLTDSAGAPTRASYQVAGGVLVRLGTGVVDDPDVFFDLGTGDAQTDVEGRLFGLFHWGSRLGLATDVRYGIQGPTTLVRRVAPPESVLPPSLSRRLVETENCCRNKDGDPCELLDHAAASSHDDPLPGPVWDNDVCKRDMTQGEPT